jgi:aspartyl aminopeptidase
MPFCCFSYNILKSVIDLSDVSIHIDLSKNVVDISNIKIHLDISNNERTVIEHHDVSKIVNETTLLLSDAKETILDISNNLQHILNVKEEFLAVDLTEPLLQLDSK